MQHSNGKGLDMNKVFAAALLFCADTVNDKPTILLNLLQDGKKDKKINGSNDNWKIFWENLILIAWDVMIELADSVKYTESD